MQPRDKQFFLTFGSRNRKTLKMNFLFLCYCLCIWFFSFCFAADFFFFFGREGDNSFGQFFNFVFCIHLQKNYGLRPRKGVLLCSWAKHTFPNYLSVNFVSQLEILATWCIWFKVFAATITRFWFISINSHSKKKKEKRKTSLVFSWKLMICIEGWDVFRAILTKSAICCFFGMLAIVLISILLLV